MQVQKATGPRKLPKGEGGKARGPIAFFFAFNDAPAAAAADEHAASSSAGELVLRASRVLTVNECAADALHWPTEEVEVAGGLRLTKVTPPEDALPALLREELEQEQNGSAATAASTSVSTAAHAAALLTDSDLLPDVYEGGLKVWECARDLMSVMHEMSHCGELPLAGTHVLEAGCGAGLPAVLSLRLGARRVVLQDFNAAVLRAVTMPTVRLNQLWARVEAGEVRFLSGDWARASALLLEERRAAAAVATAADAPQPPRSSTRRSSSSSPSSSVPSTRDEEISSSKVAAPEGGFDLVLSADTLYNTSASRRLWQLVREQLRPGGTALIASKSYYFGCGGSVADFKAIVSADGRFECRTVRVFEDGASNRRECFAITWRRPGESASQVAGEGPEALPEAAMRESSPPG